MNATKKPGEWQKFVIDFQAPKFEGAGKKISNAKFVKVDAQRQGDPRERGNEGPTPRRDRQGSGDGPAHVPGRPRPGGVPEYQDYADEVTELNVFA